MMYLGFIKAVVRQRWVRLRAQKYILVSLTYRKLHSKKATVNKTLRFSDVFRG